MTLLAWEMSTNVQWLAHSLVLPFLRTGVKIDFFQSCGHFWVFQICWHIECITLIASSFRILNSSTGIPLHPLALLIAVLPSSTWGYPSNNTGVGNNSLLLGTFQIQGSNTGLLHCRQILYHLSHQEGPTSTLPQYKQEGKGKREGWAEQEESGWELWKSNQIWRKITMIQKSLEKREIWVVTECVWCCRGEIILLGRYDQSSTSWVEKRREIEEAEDTKALSVSSVLKENERECIRIWAWSVIG